MLALSAFNFCECLETISLQSLLYRAFSINGNYCMRNESADVSKLHQIM